MPKLSKKDEAAKMSITESRRRKEIALMQLREMEAARKRGELIEAGVAESLITELGVKVRDGALALASRIAARLPSEWRRQTFTVADAEVRAMLTAISGAIRGGGKPRGKRKARKAAYPKAVA